MSTASETRPTARRVGPALLLLAGLWFCSRLIPYTLDDAFIYFRYAENIARGLGPVFNQGEAAVEGFTSPLWTLVLAAAARLVGGPSLQAVASLLGLLCYAGCVLVLLNGSRRDDAPVIALVPAALWSLSAGAIFYSVTGLETPAFVLIVLLVHGALNETISRKWGLIAAALALWTRPEGGWLIVAGAAQLLVLRSKRNALPLLGALIAGGLLLLAVRWHFFHELLPNTFYAKRPDRVRGLYYVINSVHLPFVAALLAGGLLGAIFGDRRDRATATASLAWLVAAALEGGDWMPNARLLQPALALAALASAGMIRSGQKITAVALVGLAVVSGWSAKEAVFDARNALDSIVEEQRTLDKWMKGTGVHSVALMDIGETGFELPEINILDLDGLTDAKIAHTPGGHLNKVFDLGYVFDERRPDMIVVRVIRPPRRDANGKIALGYYDGMSLIEGNILADPRLRTDYDLIFVQTPPALRYPLYARAIYVRRGFPFPPEARPAMDMGFLSDPAEKS